MTQEDAMSYYNNVHCPAGMVLNGVMTIPVGYNNFFCGNVNQTGATENTD
jgi:hypothetical protein